MSECYYRRDHIDPANSGDIELKTKKLKWIHEEFSLSTNHSLTCIPPGPTSFQSFGVGSRELGPAHCSSPPSLNVSLKKVLKTQKKIHGQNSFKQSTPVFQKLLTKVPAEEKL